MLKNKKAKMTNEHWAEWVSLGLLVIGLALALISDASIISYIIIFLGGVFVGRIYYLRRHEVGFPFFMITVFFLVGYLIGVKIRNRGLVFLCLVFFAMGVYLGVYLHMKRYLR